MKLKPKIIIGEFNNISNELENNNRDSFVKKKFLTLTYSPSYTDKERAMVDAIAADIRGSYGIFLKQDKENFVWSGNLFDIKVDYNNQLVKLKYLYSDNEKDLTQTYKISLNEWISTINCWKQMYLKELGFLEFDSIALSHFLGLLILTQVSLHDSEPDDLERYIRIAIKKCSERYGVSENVIRSECKHVTGLYYINDVYSWIYDFFNDYLEYNSTNKFVKQHITDIDDSFPKKSQEYLGITL